jgi:hypothetical protein
MPPQVVFLQPFLNYSMSVPLAKPDAALDKMFGVLRPPNRICRSASEVAKLSKPPSKVFKVFKPLQILRELGECLTMEESSCSEGELLIIAPLVAAVPRKLHARLFGNEANVEQGSVPDYLASALKNRPDTYALWLDNSNGAEVKLPRTRPLKPNDKLKSLHLASGTDLVVVNPEDVLAADFKRHPTSWLHDLVWANQA